MGYQCFNHYGDQRYQMKLILLTVNMSVFTVGHIFQVLWEFAFFDLQISFSPIFFRWRNRIFRRIHRQSAPCSKDKSKCFQRHKIQEGSVLVSVPVSVTAGIGILCFPKFSPFPLSQILSPNPPNFLFPAGGNNIHPRNSTSCRILCPTAGNFTSAEQDSADLAKKEKSNNST